MNGSVRRYLIFSLSGEQLALPLESIAEVLDSPAILYPIPRAPACLMGVMSSHGDLVPVLDLAALLGLGSSAQGEKILVLEKGMACLALKVDLVSTILSTQTVQEEVQDIGEQPETVLRTSTGTVPLLPVHQVLDMLEALITT